MVNEARLLLRASRGRVGGKKVPRLLPSWLHWSLQRSSRQRPYQTKIGPLTLCSANVAEARSLFAEIFLRDTYGLVLEMHEPRILDCGANCGFATAYFKLAYPDAWIVAFEPAPEAFRMLEHNVRVNRLSNVELVNAACGRKEGKAGFTVSEGSSFLSSGNLYRRSGTALDVPLVRVYAWVKEHVDLLKLDVEGAEHDVLDDLIETGLISRVEHLAIEYHHLIASAESQLGSFLHKLEACGFNYSLLAGEGPCVRFGHGF